MTCNTFNAPTSKFSTYALTQEQLLSQIDSFDTIIGKQNDPINNYDINVVVKTIADTYTLFNNYDSVTKHEDYPYLSDRLTRTFITPSEYAEFLNTSKITIDDATKITTGKISTVGVTLYFDQLDYYYNENFANSKTGGFCSSFAGGLMQLLGLISAGANLISQLKNGVAAFIAQLTSIKNLLTGLVDQIKKFMLQQMQNVIAQVTKLVAGFNSMATFFYNKARQVKDFFSDLNMDNLKAKIESLISQLAGGYEKLTPEVIAYLLYRFCQLAELVTNFMKSPVDGLKAIATNFAAQKLALSNFSNNSKLNAVNAGGYRMDPFEVARMRDAAAERINAGGNMPNGEARYVAVRFTEAEQDRVATLTSSGNEYITFSSSVLNQNDPVPEAGWKNVKYEVWLRFFKVAQRMGMKFTITSGYRSKKYNDALRARGINAARNSPHISGLAIDVSMAGLSRERICEFIKYSSQLGFGGIEYYQGENFCHIDLGPVRRWNPGNGGGNIEQAIQIHVRNGFKIGSA